MTARPLHEQRADALQRFAATFARGAHWDAHEHLEALWRDDREDLWQALIQLAATFVLLTSNRLEGARRVLARAQAKLAPLPVELHGVDVAWLRDQYAELSTLLCSTTPSASDTLPATAALFFEELSDRLGC